MDYPGPYFYEMEQRLRFKPLWELGIRGRGAAVAVLDTGFSRSDEIDSAIIDEKDFTGEGEPRGLGYRHGSSVMKGIRLIAPEASVANFKVLSEDSPPLRENVCEAVQTCIRQYPKYQIINLSLYFDPEGCSDDNPCSLCSTVNEATEKGIVVVAAAGNLGPEPGTITCPGLARGALTVVAIWTKRETEWWNSTAALKKWWWEHVTGEFGKAVGTSFSAAWASGGVALLKSALPESHPKEIKEAIFGSANPLPNAPETKGMFQCKEAFDWLLAPDRYTSANRALYFNAGNKDAQWSGSYFARSLGLALSYIRFKMIAQARYAEAAAELVDIRGWLVPGALLDYEGQIDQLLEMCEKHVSATS